MARRTIAQDLSRKIDVDFTEATEELRRNAEAAARFLAALPAAVRDLPGDVYRGAHMAPWVKVYVPTVADVLNFIHALPPIPALRVENGCTSFVPVAKLPDRDKNAKLTPILPFTMDVERSYLNHRDEVGVLWFTTLVDDTIIRIEAQVEQVPSTIRIAHSARWRGTAEDRYAEKHTSLSTEAQSWLHKTGGSAVKWWSSPDSLHPNNFTCYWPEANAKGDADSIFTAL